MFKLHDTAGILQDVVYKTKLSGTVTADPGTGDQVLLAYAKDSGELLGSTVWDPITKTFELYLPTITDERIFLTRIDNNGQYFAETYDRLSQCTVNYTHGEEFSDLGNNSFPTLASTCTKGVFSFPFNIIHENLKKVSGTFSFPSDYKSGSFLVNGTYYPLGKKANGLLYSDDGIIICDASKSENFTVMDILNSFNEDPFNDGSLIAAYPMIKDGKDVKRLKNSEFDKSSMFVRAGYYAPVTPIITPFPIPIVINRTTTTTIYFEFIIGPSITSATTMLLYIPNLTYLYSYSGSIYWGYLNPTGGSETSYAIPYPSKVTVALVIVPSGSDKLYINGVLTATKTIVTPIKTNDEYLAIPPSRHSSGLPEITITGISIFNRELTLAEIQSLANVGRQKNLPIPQNINYVQTEVDKISTGTEDQEYILLFEALKNGKLGNSVGFNSWYTTHFGITEKKEHIEFNGSTGILYRTNTKNTSNIDIYLRFYPVAITAQCIWKIGSATEGIAIGINASSQVTLYTRNSGVLTSISFTPTVSVNTWYYVTLSNGLFKLFSVTGTELASISNTLTIGNYAGLESIGGAYDGSPIAGTTGNSGYFNGYVSNLLLVDKDTLGDYVVGTEHSLSVWASDVELPVELVKWDIQNDSAVLWTKIPELTPDGISLYIKQVEPTKSGNTGSLVSQEVWNNDFIGVYHMNYDSKLLDSTSNKLHGAFINIDSSNFSSDLTGSKLTLNGTDEYVRMNYPVIKGTQRLSVSALFNPNTIADGDSLIDVALTDSADNELQLSMQFDSTSKLNASIADSSETLIGSVVSDTITASTDYFATLNYTGKSEVDGLTLYVDGVKEDSDNSTGKRISNSNAVFNIGKDAYSANYYDGSISELFIRNKPMTVDFEKVLRLSVMDQLGTFTVQQGSGNTITVTKATHHWTMDNITGGVLVDEIGSINLVYETTQITGRFGMAMSSASPDLNITAPSDIAFKSLSFWFKRKTTTNVTNIVGTNNTAQMFGIDPNYNHYLYFYNGIDPFSRSAIAINDTNWHHLVLVEGTTANKHRFYLDGTLYEQELNSYFNGVFRIIGRHNSAAGQENCDIDNVQVYDYVLSELEVLELYNKLNETTLTEEVSVQDYWTPDQIGSLSLWLDAADSDSVILTDGVVSEWRDKSGYNAHAIQNVDTTNRPIYDANNKCVLFDGNNDYLYNTIKVFSLSSRSFFVVAEELSPGVNKGIFTIEGIYNDWDSVNGLVGLGSSDRVTKYLAMATSISHSYWTPNGNGADYGFYDTPSSGVIVKRIYNDNFQVLSGTSYFDGTLKSNNTALRQFSTISFGGYALGCRIGLGSTKGTFPSKYNGYFAGRIFEVIYFDSILSTEDRQKVEGYLAHKWNIELPLDHPYYSEAPIAIDTYYPPYRIPYDNFTDSIYVSLTGNDTTGNGSSDFPYATISKAYSMASSSSVIVLKEGNHTISSRITLTKHLSVVSESRDCRNTAIVVAAGAGGCFDGSNTYKINVHYLRIEVNVSASAYTGIFWRIGAGSSFSRLFVDVACNNSYVIIWYELNGLIEVTNCTIRKRAGANFFFCSWSNYGNTANFRNCISNHSSVTGQSIPVGSNNMYPGGTNPNYNISLYPEDGVFLTANSPELVSGSPAIDLGTSVDVVTEFYIGTAPDIGAVEYGTWVDPSSIQDIYWDNTTVAMTLDGANSSTNLIDIKGNSITSNSGVTLSNAQKKYGETSALFGSSNTFTITSMAAFNFLASDFTVEFWFYMTASPAGYVQLFTSGNFQIRFGDSGFYSYLQAGINTGSLSTIYSCNSDKTSLLNAWTHVAFVRSNGNVSLYVNGVKRGISTGSYPTVFTNTSYADNSSHTATSAFFGSGFTGYIDDIRITKGVARYTDNFTPSMESHFSQLGIDPYWSQTVFLSNFNGLDNATSFVDLKGKVITANGNAKISQSQSKFGGQSAYFDGNGDYLTIPDSTDWDFGIEDFTIECWIMFTSAITDQNFVGNYNNPSLGWSFRRNSAGVLQFAHGDTLIVGASWNPSLNIWYHIAVTRLGTNAKLFVNGVPITSAVSSHNITGSSNALAIGALNSGSWGWYFQGYIDDLRITKGVARYTDNFTPPDQQLNQYYVIVQEEEVEGIRLKFDIDTNIVSTTVKDVPIMLQLSDSSGISSLDVTSIFTKIKDENTKIWGLNPRNSEFGFTKSGFANFNSPHITSEAGPYNIPNTAYKFTGNVNSILKINDSISRSYLMYSLTFSMWIRIDTLQASSTELLLFGTTGASEFQITHRSNGELVYRHTSSGMVAGHIRHNKWSHFMLTRDHVTKTVKGYVDGILKYTYVYSTIPAISSNDIFIGGSTTAGSVCTLSDIRLFDRVLSDAMLQKIYNERIANFKGISTSILYQDVPVLLGENLTSVNVSNTNLVYYSLSADKRTYYVFTTVWKPIVSDNPTIHGFAGETQPYYWDDDASEWVFSNTTMEETISIALQYSGNRMDSAQLNNISNFTGIYSSSVGTIHLAVSLCPNGTSKYSFDSVIINNKQYWISESYNLSDYCTTISSSAIKLHVPASNPAINYLSGTKVYCKLDNGSSWVECVNNTIPNLPNGFVTAGRSVIFKVVWDLSIWINADTISLEVIIK